MYFYYEKCRNEGVYAVLSVMSPISRGNQAAVWPPYLYVLLSHTVFWEKSLIKNLPK